MTSSGAARLTRTSWELGRAYLSARTERSVLGFAWYLLNPLVLFAVMYGVHTRMPLATVQDYPLYLMIGLVCFSYIRGATFTMARSFTSATALLRGVNVPPTALVAGRAIEAFGAHIAELVVVAATMVWSGVSLVGLLWYIPTLALVTVAAIGIGTTLAVLSAYANDVINVLGYAMTVILFAAPVFYHMEASMRPWFVSLDPLTPFLDASRAALMESRIDATALLQISAWAGVSVVVAWIVARLFGGGIVERV